MDCSIHVYGLFYLILKQICKQIHAVIKAEVKVEREKV